MRGPSQFNGPDAAPPDQMETASETHPIEVLDENAEEVEPEMLSPWEVQTLRAIDAHLSETDPELAEGLSQLRTPRPVPAARGLPAPPDAEVPPLKAGSALFAGLLAIWIASAILALLAINLGDSSNPPAGQPTAPASSASGTPGSPPR